MAQNTISKTIAPMLGIEPCNFVLWMLLHNPYCMISCLVCFGIFHTFVQFKSFNELNFRVLKSFISRRFSSDAKIFAASLAKNKKNCKSHFPTNGFVHHRQNFWWDDIRSHYFARDVCARKKLLSIRHTFGGVDKSGTLTAINSPKTAINTVIAVRR